MTTHTATATTALPTDTEAFDRRKRGASSGLKNRRSGHPRPERQERTGHLRTAVVGSVVTALFGGLLSLGAGAAPAGADTTALTDDSSVAVPTAAEVFSDVDEATINGLTAQGRRIADIDVFNAAAKTFTISTVANSGAYAVPGWWWYFDQSPAQVAQSLEANKGRLVDIEAYTDGGVTKYATVMVQNTGAAARGWTYLIGATSTQIDANINAKNQRMIDIDAYTDGGTKKYAAVFVTNTGSDAKSWQWWTNQTSAGVASLVNSFGGRIVALDRQPDGTYVFAQVKNSGTDTFAWRHHYGLDLSQVSQVLKQFGLRAVDVETYTVGNERRYDLVGIDNLPAESRRLSNILAPSLTGSNGLPTASYGFFLKPVGSSTPSAALQQTTNFEPASAVKAVHNLAVMRKVKDEKDSLQAANFGYYIYPGSSQANNKDACPDPDEEIPANRVLTTVDTGRSMMMINSDNRTTRGVVLRYGLSYVQQTAAFAGMTSSSIQQDFVGCGFKYNRRNQINLVDFGKLYEGVENGTLLGTGALRTSFFTPMNGQAFNGGNAENDVIDIVKAEAAAQGKSGAVTDFVKNMSWQFKQGSYTQGCGGAFTSCASGFYSVKTIAGVIRIPFKSADTVAPKAYVFGSYIDGVNTGCVGCPQYPSTSERVVRAELFRSQIRTALTTW